MTKKIGREKIAANNGNTQQYLLRALSARQRFALRVNAQKRLEQAIVVKQEIGRAQQGRRALSVGGCCGCG